MIWSTLVGDSYNHEDIIQNDLHLCEGIFSFLFFVFGGGGKCIIILPQKNINFKTIGLYSDNLRPWRRGIHKTQPTNFSSNFTFSKMDL